MRKSKYTIKCDVWSIGVILFHILEKKSPFHAATVRGLSTKIDKGKY